MRTVGVRRLAQRYATLLVSVMVTGIPAIAAPDSPFGPLAGAWSGSGQVQLESGGKERLTCRAYYTPKDDGVSLGMAIRCASASYKIELRSSLRYERGQVTGTWEERNFNAAGNVSGRATGGNISLSISGGISGTMSLAYSAARQTVSISTETAGLRGVSMQLTRG
jgi:hypothetical protein